MPLTLTSSSSPLPPPPSCQTTAAHTFVDAPPKTLTLQAKQDTPAVSRYDVLFAAAHKQRKVWKEASLTVGASRAVLFDVAAKKTVACCTSIASTHPNKIFLEMAGRPNHAFEEGDSFAFNAQWVVQVLVVMHAHLRPYGDPIAAAPVALGGETAMGHRPAGVGVVAPRHRPSTSTTGSSSAVGSAGFEAVPSCCNGNTAAVVSALPAGLYAGGVATTTPNPEQQKQQHHHRLYQSGGGAKDTVSVAHPGLSVLDITRFHRRTDDAILRELRAAYPTHFVL